MFPLALAQYRRAFKTIYESNNKIHDNERKQEEVLVFGQSIDFENLVASYFASRQLYLRGITIRMATRISNIIERGRSDGLTLPQIARQVAEDTGFARSRASLVARTELHNATSFANHNYYVDVGNTYGLPMVKRWVATGDTRTRPDHVEASGQTVGIDEAFTVGGVPMQYAGDPNGGAKNVVNCRCVIVYVDERDDIV